MNTTETKATSFDPANPSNTLDMCCGGKKCPVVTLDADQMHMSDNGQTITFTRDQWRDLQAWAKDRGF